MRCVVRFLDADVPMYGMLCANSCAIMSDGRKVIDPTMREGAKREGWCARAR